jgi:hypothetical protein
MFIHDNFSLTVFVLTLINGTELYPECSQLPNSVHSINTNLGFHSGKSNLGKIIRRFQNCKN